MTNSGMQTCPLCKVKIIAGGVLGDRVIFSMGPPGTRTSLWNKVCKFTERPGCINRDPSAKTYG
ncbi:hypothetical protein ACQ4M4_16770 [Leptolyngbya sp. AN02str]|uniref:hypothetical protein n=1 Tax=Leptolyngbya sp. AN02str TaxID=3423363 RepID=UPI003D3150D2